MNAAPQGRNVAGIIPISGWESSFDLPWPDYLQPIREGYLAAERSVYECAIAGCDSIWVVCNDDVAPLLKSRIGDYVLDPKYFKQKDFVKRKDYHEKWIPIFYTPISMKDRDRRDSLGWSILHGALTSFVISNKMSRWVSPTKYFVSFPYGIYNPDILKNHLDTIRGSESFYLSYEGQTVKDNKYLAFTFFPEDWPKIKWHVKNACTGGDKKIPVQERWSSKNFTLDKIFDIDVLSLDNVIEVEEYYSLDKWDSLLQYYASSCVIPRPSKKFMKPYFMKEENEY